MTVCSIIVTGASSGLGRATALRLARDPRFQLVLACRDAHRAEQTRVHLQAVAAQRVLVAPLELASLASIRAFPAALKSLQAGPIAALICNAGVQDVSGMRRSDDGFERTFAVNHLGHFALTQELLPLLMEGARVLVVSSNTHDPATGTGMPAPRYRDPALLAAGSDEGRDPGLAGRVRYTTSKLCNVYFARELARRLASSDDVRLRSLQVAAFDPGMMPGTDLARQYGPVLRFLWRYVLPLLTLFRDNVNSVARSAERLAGLAADGLHGWPTGSYVSRGVAASPSQEAQDDVKALALWRASEVLSGRALTGG